MIGRIPKMLASVGTGICDALAARGMDAARMAQPQAHPQGNAESRKRYSS